ncbi:hypothetical protein D3C78_354920 [compost metagenome]
MKERPILFSGPMVRAILEGRKTVTRRTVKGNQIPEENASESDPVLRWTAVAQNDSRYGFIVNGSTATECAQELAKFGRCPYGQPGDRLWVREAFLPDPDADHRSWANWTETYVSWSGCGSRIDGVPPALRKPEHCIYREGWSGGELAWRPSIHMPRWASRILLEITAVRIERLTDISYEQARAEGYPADREAETGGSDLDAWLWFRSLWKEINGPTSFDANPWVWVVEFKMVTP